MRGSSISARFAAASAACAALLAALVACSSFGTADTEPTQGDGASETAAGDGGSDFNVAGDGASFGPAQCFDFTRGQSDFVSYADQGGMVGTSGGLSVQYQTTTSGAAWRRSFPMPPGAKGAKLTIDASVSAFSKSGGWYAGFGTLLNGDPQNVENISLVHMVLNGTSTTASELSADLFPNGTGGTGSPVSSTPFGMIPGGSMTQVSAILDVVWSTLAETNVHAQLGSGTPVPVEGMKTLVGPIAPTLGVSLGGTAASGQPAMTILFTRVCVEFR